MVQPLKSCEIKGGGQEMAVKLISINIIAVISWLPPLISQLFHPGFLRLHYFFPAWLFFVWISLLYKAPKPTYG